MEFYNTKQESQQKKSYLVFGSTKTGKTLLASTLPSDKCLFINTENNMDSLYGADINYVNAYNYNEIMHVLEQVELKKIPVDWVFIDSISDILKKIFNDEKKKTNDGRQLYSWFEERYTDLIAKIKKLPCNIVAIGRQTQVKDEITGGLVFGAATPWDKTTLDLPYNFSAVFASRCVKLDNQEDCYFLQCHADNQYQVGVRTNFGEKSPLSEFERPDLLEIHKKIMNPVQHEMNLKGE